MPTGLRSAGRFAAYLQQRANVPSTPPELLSTARRIVRSHTRAASYWAAADRLSHLWLGEPLRSTSEFHLAAGPDLGAIIDWLYDEKLSSHERAVEELPRLTGRLQEMVDLEKAAEELRRLEEQPAEMGLVDATCAIVACLTVHGYVVLRERGSEELASPWLEAWAEAMGKQNVQQQRACGLGLLARLAPEARPECMRRLGLTPEDLVPGSTSFSEGVEEFLEKYGETSAATVAVLGSLPFSELPMPELECLLRLCTGKSDLVTTMSQLFRLAPDVSFDPAESMNTGVFASAAEQRRSVLEVGSLSKPELDAKLAKEWELRSGRARRSLEGLLAEHAREVGPVSSTWVPALYRVLERLVPGTWKN